MATPTSAAATTLDRPSVLDDRSLFGHPRGLGLLFVVEMWERFSYYGMRALLVLYLVNALNWGDGNAARLYGTYTSLVYLTPLIGGFLADRLIGTRRSLVIGGILIALGHFALAFGPSPVGPGSGPPGTDAMLPFYAGLGLIILGTGFFKPNVSTMVGQVYRDGDQRRDAGFTIFYMGINLGAFLGPLVAGGLGQSERFGWHWGFGSAGVGMVLGLIVYMWGRDKYLPGIGFVTREADKPAAAAESVTDQSINYGHALIGAGIGSILAFLSGGSIMAYLFGVIIGATIGVTLLGTRGEERNRVIALFIVVFFVIFFWMAFEQAGSSMNLFADRYTDLDAAGVEIKSSWFQSVNAFFILLFAPVFAALWTGLGRAGREPSTALKMALGLVLLGLGFVFMIVGAQGADACTAEVGREAAIEGGRCAIVSPMWLVGAYLLHTLGELCLSPVGLSYVTKVAPVRFASLLMGAWFLANSAAQYIGGLLAAQIENIPEQSTFFTIFVVTSFGAAVLMFIMVPLLKRLTRSVQS
ncbi:MAG TPA: peptide MFS transporter [Gemmatimonadaceae bacterium]|nr:peptide MFS transporter [Gemmatimonadaceae bacterium]